MQYNTEKEHLIMPEYGRGVQNMVKLAMALPEKSQREACAKQIVKIMSRLHSVQMSKEDTNHKLWNHLARISEYRLDIDYPVTIVPMEQIKEHPAPLPYPMKKIKRKHYGFFIEKAFELITEMQEGPERDELVKRVANQMKQNLFVWNRDSMDSNVIAQDFSRYTGGKIQLDLETFRFAPVGMPTNQSLQGGKKKKKGRG